MNSISSLPDPDPAALERSRSLSALIQHDIAESKAKSIGFDRFMSRALYEPNLGYYTSGNPIFGAEGDFVTAPESGSLLSRVIAHWCQDLGPIAGDQIVEYGAGSGQLALDVCTQLLQLAPDGDWQYAIVEKSERLAARQRDRFERELPAAMPRLSWHLDQYDGLLSGIVIANEVVDALPAKRWEILDSRILELGVTYGEAGFEWRQCEPEAIPPEVSALSSQLPTGYRTETIPGLAQWLSEIRNSMQQGVMLLLDYGYPRHEFMHPSRSDGTLKCHYKHRVHDDPFYFPGLQDITTSVDFSTVADLAYELGFDIGGFTTQAHFLLDNGLEAIMAAASGGDAVEQYQMAQEAKRLLLPGEMGETVKVMACSVGLSEALEGFRHDLRHRLGGFAEVNVR